MNFDNQVYVANVYGAPPPKNLAAFSLVKLVTLEELNQKFEEKNSTDASTLYRLRYVANDHEQVNVFTNSSHTKILYHMLTGNGTIMTRPHNAKVISSNPELCDHILALDGEEPTKIAHADITVLTIDGPKAKFYHMIGNSFMVIEYVGRGYDRLGPRHCVSYKGVSRRGGCALAKDSTLFRKLPLIEGNNESGDPSDELSKPYVVADIHPVAILGGDKSLEHYHSPESGQIEIYFTGRILRGKEKENPHIMYNECYVRPPIEEEIPSYLHVHPSHISKYFENWLLREGDIAFIPPGIVHRAQGEGNKEGGALVGVVAIPWFITHNELVVKNLHDN